jgi:Phage Mu protein F like protein
LTLLAVKLQLEQELPSRLMRVFWPYVRNRATQPTIAHSHQWLTEFEQVLAEHYARVVFAVTGRDPPPGRLKLADAALSLAHQHSLSVRARRRAQELMQSADRLLSKEDVEVKDGLGSKIAAKVRAVMAKIKAKLAGIAVSETNGPAEEARMEDARRKAGNRQLMKSWSTMQDHRVRDWHAEAEGQVRHVSQPFDVGGERLMHPGDNALGASLGNLINCRCSARYVVENADGTTEVFAETVRLTPRNYNREPGRVDHPALITRDIRIADGIRTRVFLGDMVEAVVAVRGGVIRVTRPGNPWRLLAEGRFTHGLVRGPRVQGLRVTDRGQGLGIEELLQRSIAAMGR